MCIRDSYYSDIRWLMILLMPIAGKMVQGAIVYKAIYPREKGIGIYVGTVSLGTVIGTDVYKRQGYHDK